MLESRRGGHFEIIIGDRSKGGQNHLDGFRPVGANEPGPAVFKLSLLVSNGGAKYARVFVASKFLYGLSNM